ncbi:MAG: pyridoxamine 5'-phosphate oxidase family protein, partial [Acetobacteraceae bacterium]|nr:pyridoxamine 5'-phosphate oxidase family protein [Acetobacteraceae bacterium]
TATADGQPDCSFKGGPAGFVRVTGPSELAFPDYDGNGMFKSLGNLRANPAVGLLFINMHGAARRLRVNGDARVLRDDPLLATTIGAQLIVRVTVRVIFPNCPRYLPAMTLAAPSEFTPQAGRPVVEPGWKTTEAFKGLVPPRPSNWTDRN